MKTLRAVILFADIRGSTEFGYTQRVERLNDMLRDFHKTCYEAIKNFREKKRLGRHRLMASCRGDECCVLLCEGKSPEDELLAIELAIYLKEMWKQSDFCQRNAEAAVTGLIPQVDLRIGIGCGEVALDDDVWSRRATLEGIFISEAKRIEGLADEARETLIMVKWDIKEACIKAGVAVEFGDPMALKGKGVPPVAEIPVYPVKTYAGWKAIQEEIMPSPETYAERFSRALAMRQSRDLEGAIREYTRLLEVRPNDPATLNNLGNVLADLAHFEEALAHYNLSLQLRPNDPDTLNNRGVTLLKLKRYNEALADLNHALQLKPDDPMTLTNRGIVLRNLKRYEEALADYDRSLMLRPDDACTLNNRGNLLDDLERYGEALADYNRSLELRPDDPDTLYNRGNTFDNLKRYDEALSDYNRSLELRPDHPATLNNRGVTLANLKRYEEALVDYNRALRFEPGSSRTFYNIACLYSRWERYDESLQWLEKAIAADTSYRQKALEDPDLEPLRADSNYGPRFWKVVGREDAGQ